MKKKIILTGFTPFGKHEENPTQTIIKHFAARTDNYSDFDLTAETIPTTYAAAENRIQSLIKTQHPDAVLSLGLAGNREKVFLERVALNLDDAAIPDNDGVLRQGDPIFQNGPPAYFPNFPVAYLQKELLSRGFDIGISNHAGTYVCNHIYYTAAHTVQTLERNAITGFIHVPKAAPVDAPEGAWTISRMIDVIDAALTLLHNISLYPI